MKNQFRLGLLALTISSVLTCSVTAFAQSQRDDNPRNEQSAPGGNNQEQNERRRPPRNEEDQQNQVDLPDNQASPARRIDRNQRPPRNEENNFEVRNFDGTNNNVEHDHMGAAHEQLLRYTFADYSDGISSLAGEERPSAREISNIVFSQSSDSYNNHGASDFLWQWGQFLDHDLDLTDGVTPTEPADIAVPAGDVYFDPTNSGTVTISLNRSIYDTESGTSSNNPRQQINEITAWIDASNVYGSSLDRANALRTLDGTGKLKTSEGNLLPFNEEGITNGGGNSSSLFLAGDVRANEQVGLTAMHTLFVREHNRLAERIADNNPSLSGEEVYQAARKTVAAQMQIITYNEFLPMLLGSNALSRYEGYNPNVEAGIANEFSTAAYRLGHSLLSTEILRLDANGNTVAEGNLSLRDAFFSPTVIVEGGIDSIFRGLATQQCQGIDTFVIDDVRNFLFGAPGSGGFDLVSLNIQRGRDHGLPSYNDARISLGLSPVTSFADITSKPELQAKLNEAYGSVNSIDLWVGGLAEDHHEDAMVGELFFTILRQQFTALRDGDRFWYSNYLTREEQDRVRNTTLSRIIRRNTDIGSELQRNVFAIPSAN